MNTVDEKTKSIFQYFDSIYTFDFFDAKKYNIKYKHTPYSSKIKLKNNTIIYDTLFLGRAKNRIDTIVKIKTFLDTLGLNNKFLVLGTKIHDISINYFLGYPEYLDLVSKSKCIIEINKENQSGCSLRLLESIFLEKKLLTNNKSVIFDPYYNSENIYIFENDNRNLKDFITSPYEKCDKDINKLCFESWIKEF